MTVSLFLCSSKTKRIKMEEQIWRKTFLIFVTFFLIENVAGGQPRTFELDRERQTFLLDGNPFRFISGSIHNFRVPAAYWNDRFRKIRAGGYNAVQVNEILLTQCLNKNLFFIKLLTFM